MAWNVSKVPEDKCKEFWSLCCTKGIKRKLLAHYRTVFDGTEYYSKQTSTNSARAQYLYRECERKWQRNTSTEDKLKVFDKKTTKTQVLDTEGNVIRSTERQDYYARSISFELLSVEALYKQLLMTLNEWGSLRKGELCRMLYGQPISLIEHLPPQIQSRMANFKLDDKGNITYIYWDDDEFENAKLMTAVIAARINKDAMEDASNKGLKTINEAFVQVDVGSTTDTEIPEGV